MPDPARIRLVDPDGVERDVPVENAGSYLQDPRWKVATTESTMARLAGQEREAEYGGVGGAVNAGLAGAARTVTLGGSDVLARAIGGEQARINLEGYRDVNPGVSTGSEIAAALLPIGAAGAIGRIGRGISALGEGAGVAGRIGTAALGGAAEGALYGAGSGISELALSDDPLTTERIASAIGSNALYGAGFGTGLGGLGKAAEIGLSRAKGAIDGALERRVVKARTPAEAVESGDLGLLDKRALDTLEKDELARVRVEQAPQREALVDELQTYQRANRDQDALRGVIEASGERDITTSGAAFVRADVRLRNLLDDRIGFAENPEVARPLLRKQRQAIETIEDWAQEQKQLWKADVEAAPQRIRDELMAQMRPSRSFPGAGGGKPTIPGELGPFTAEGLDGAVQRVLAERQGLQWGGAISGGLKEPTIAKLQPYISSTLDWNAKFQAALDDLAKAPITPRLAKIAEARAALEVPQAPSLGGALFNAAMPFAGPLGAAAAVGNRALGSFRKIAEVATARVGQATSTLLGTAAKGVSAAAPYAPLVASKVLAAVRFNDQKHAEEPKDLHEAYTRATDGIKSQITVTPDGQYQMRPDARVKMAASFDGIRTSAPLLADQLEEHSARRIEWLAGQIPRKPDVFALQTGPDTWRPSTMEIAAFARKVSAVEDPHAVFDRLAHGAITSEDAAAIREVYPEMFHELTQQVSAQLSDLKKSLPYHKKIALSIFTGLPIDPSLDPHVIAALQSMYPTEPGSAGASQTPRASPQFGSMKSAGEDARTPSQERAA